MTTKIALPGHARIPIHNNNSLPEQRTANSKAESYFLTRKQLEEYKRTGIFPNRTSDKESENPVSSEIKSKLELLQEKYPDLESLYISRELSKTMSQWAKDNKMSNSYFYQLEKKYQAEAKAAEPQINAVPYCGVKPVEIDANQPILYTPAEAEKIIKSRLTNLTGQFIEELRHDKAETPEIDHIDTYIVKENETTVHECNSIAEAITHIKSNYTIAEIEANCIPKIYKEVPIDFRVNVVVGK